MCKIERQILGKLCSLILPGICREMALQTLGTTREPVFREQSDLLGQYSDISYLICDEALIIKGFVCEE